MTLKPLTLACPQCGSNEVFYSCEPKCCFNHVCSRCRTTFETMTTLVGEVAGELGALPPEPESTNPTAPCGRCGDWKVFVLADSGTSPGQLVCVSCKALLTLGLENVAAS